MKKIFEIFIHDMRRIRRSVVAIIMIMGLCIVPCLYAWMNIMSNFDPYSEDATSRMKIAVASEDTGTELYGLNVCVGDTVIENLKTNSTIGWVFPDSADEAIAGVESGKYYAAMVVPANFSEDLMGFVDDDFAAPAIRYYENQKKNIIAATITDKAMTTVRDEINGVFVSTLFGTVGKASTALSNSGIDGDDIYDSTIKQLTYFENDLSAMIKLTDATSSLTGAAGGLINTTNGYLPQVQSLSHQTQDTLQDIWNRIGTDKEQVNDTKAAVLLCLDEAQTTLDTLSAWTDTELEAAKNTAQISRDTLIDARETVEELCDLMLDLNEYAQKNMPTDAEMRKQLADTQALVESLNNVLTPLLTWQITDNIAQGNLGAAQSAQQSAAAVQTAGPQIIMNLSTLQSALKKLDGQIFDCYKLIEDSQDALDDALKSAGHEAGQLYDDLDEIQTDLLKDIDDCQTSVANLQSNLSEAEHLDTIMTGVQDNLTITIGILSHSDSTFDSASAALSKYSAALAACGSDINATHGVLVSILGVVQDIHTHLEDWNSDGEMEKLFDWISDDPDNLTEFLKSPVDINSVSVYGIDNYGSGMAPFYTILALWVGALLTTVFLRSDVETSDYRKLRTYQEYFGRYIIFFIIGQVQVLLTVLGNLFYIGIQCNHPVMFWFACAVASFVFTMINYSLKYAFSTIGEGISVLVMLVQVAGSGGTYPSEVLPVVFKVINDYLPFRYGMNAMREAIAGLYQNVYGSSLATLLLFALISIPIGIFGKLLFSWFVRLLDKAKEKTGILA